MNKSINTSGSGGTRNEACDVDFCNINNAIIDDRYEILCDILSRLPVKSLTRFKLVCKGWRSIIEQDSCFLNLQLARSDNTPQDHNIITLLISPIHDFSHECEERKVNFFSVEDNLSSYENGASSSDAPLLACHNCNCKDIILPIDNDVGTMLKPINGLLCFVNNCLGSVLICNPTTGEKTSWIQTTSGKLADEGKVDSWECDFGFGFHTPTKEHKVVCVYSIPGEVKQDIMSEETICEVLTVGSNKWRRMDEEPLYMVVTEVRSVYVNGFIYWVGYSKPEINHLFIVGFDVGREKFSKVILLPNLIGKSAPKLVEVDGHIAVLDKESDKVTLWIHSDDSNGDGKWIQEVIKMPHPLDEDSYLAFEAIGGTDMIIFKPFSPQHVELEYLYYYDRKKKEYYTRQVDNAMKPSDQILPDLGYDVTTFSRNLLPVQANK